MYKCACGARFYEESAIEEVTTYVDGYPYRETFVCCPACGGDDYWDEDDEEIQLYGCAEEDDA